VFLLFGFVKDAMPGTIDAELPVEFTRMASAVGILSLTAHRGE
jgi:hypothetical protein